VIRIDWRTIPTPPVRTIHGPLRIAPGEVWCAHCGAVIMAAMGMEGRLTGHAADCCRRPQPMPVTAILQPEEYYIIR